MTVAGSITRHPRIALCLAIVLALLLRVQNLGMGFYADDYGHQLVLAGEGLEGIAMGPSGLYDFGVAPRPGEPLFELGSFAWWTDPDWKVRFFRPLTSWSLWLDHAVFGNNAVGYHATSLVLFAVLCAALFALFRALSLGLIPSLLALLLFASEDGSAVVVGWVAHRNSLIELLCTVLAVLVLAQGRLTALRLAGSLLLAACACMAKESGITAFALIAAWLWLRRCEGVDRPMTRSGIALALGAALAFVLWLAWAGYGANTPFYPTPWGDPDRFLAHLTTLAGLAPFALVAPFPLDVFYIRPQLLPVGLLLLVPISLVLCAYVMRRARKHPAAAFLAFWFVVSLLPQGGAPLSDRLLFGSMVGAAGLLALTLAAMPVGRSARVVRVLLVLSSLVLSPLVLVARNQNLDDLAATLRASIVAADVGDPALGRREVFILQASPTTLIGLVPSSAWFVETGDLQVRMWPMQMGVRPLRWTRTGERSFELESLAEPFLGSAFEDVFRSTAGTPPVGHTWRTAAFSVEAIAVDSGGLRTIRVTCERPLDDEAMRFLVWRAGALRHVPPPPLGESIQFERGFRPATMP